MQAVKRNTKDKIRIFKSCFSGLTNAYGTYDPKTGKVRQVKKQVTDHVIHRHLTGRQSYGVYLLMKDRTNAVVVDFDIDDIEPPLAFQGKVEQYGISAYIERSKSKRYHVWIFFAGSVSARKARVLVQKVLDEIGKPETEIFPKQDKLDDTVSYGNFINAPLFGILVPKGRTVFVSTHDGNKPYGNQWDLLENVQRVSEEELDIIIEDCVSVEKDSAVGNNSYPNNEKPKNEISCFGLPPCARKILAEGVNEYQRVVCFRLACHLKRAGIPYDLALTLLKAWTRRNRPEKGKRRITLVEVTSQTKPAYEKGYRSFGCEEPGIVPYCSDKCRLHPLKLK